MVVLVVVELVEVVGVVAVVMGSAAAVAVAAVVVVAVLEGIVLVAAGAVATAIETLPHLLFKKPSTTYEVFEMC